MLTLRSGSYTEYDLYHLIRVIERGQCKYQGYKECYDCECRRACEDVKRLKLHIEKLLNEHSFSEK